MAAVQRCAVANAAALRHMGDHQLTPDAADLCRELAGIFSWQATKLSAFLEVAELVLRAVPPSEAPPP